jgi:hypothetical protein
MWLKYLTEVQPESATIEIDGKEFITIHDI